MEYTRAKKDLLAFIDIIPSLKRIVSDNLNKKNNTNHNDEYWWIIAGMYACNIWRLVQLEREKKFNLSDFLDQENTNVNYHFDFLNRLENSWIKNENVNDVNDVNDVDLKIKLSSINYDSLDLTYEEINNNDQQLYSFNSRYFNYIFKFFTKAANKKKDIIFIKTESDLELFESLFLHFLPSAYYISYPKFAEPFAKLISKFLVRNPCYTYNGFELRILDQMLIAFRTTYKKNNFKTITVTHGFGSNIGFSEIYYMTSSKLNILSYVDGFSDVLKLPDNPKKNDLDVLILAPSLVIDSAKHFSYFYSENSNLFRNDEYTKLIKILCYYGNLGLKIRIRYKAREQIKTVDEKKIEIEDRPFEECYQDYKLVIGSETGTAIGKCIHNNINHISNNTKIYMFDEEIEAKIKKRSCHLYDNFFVFEENLKKQLENMIKEKITVV